MAIDTDQIDEVRRALEAAESVDAAGIRIVGDDDVVVLQGSVATFEESSAAQQAAQQHAENVRNELVVDHNLRETGGVEPSTGDGVEEASRREGLRGSAYDPLERADDVVADVQDSLDENVAWDPPHESVEVPTRAETRGVADRRAGSPAAGPAADPDEEEPEADDKKSMADVSPEELARSARPQVTEEDTS